jgi:O-methyltransferase
MTATSIQLTSVAAQRVGVIAHLMKRSLAFSRGLMLHHRYRQYTMISKGKYAANLEICATLAPQEGCVVECGVWRGGMSAGLADIMPDRVHYLFDSFEGLPPVREIDGKSAQAWQRNTNAPEYHDNCRADASYADRAMKRSRASKFSLVPGWFADTLPDFAPCEGIAVLRLDGDWYDSTLECLIHLYHYVIPGGVIIIDDYYTWDGCTRAVHDFLAQSKRTDRIRSWRGVCFIVKDER